MANIDSASPEGRYVTKKDLEKAVRKVDMNVHNQLTEYHANMVMPMFEDMRAEMREGFKEMRKGFRVIGEQISRLNTEVSFVKDDIRGIKADLSDTVSMKEFNKLKDRVDGYHPVS